MAVSIVATLSFSATDDATVRANRPTRNAGAKDVVEVDGSPTEDALIRFEITGVGSGTVTAATLRLFVANGSSFGGRFDQLSDPNWNEDTVTWETAPPGDGGTIAVHGDTGRAGSFVEVDVTAGVTGDGAVSWRISSGINNGVDYASKEHASGNGPQLIVEVDVAGSSAPVVTVTTPAEGATYQLGSMVLADYVCIDADLSTCTGTVADGAAIDTNSVGTYGFAVTGTDGSGNATTVTHSYTVVDTADTSPPLVTVTTPAEGATYQLGSTVLADYVCSDADLATCTGTVADGAAIDTSSVGTRSFAVTGTDGSGNTTTVAHSYTVAAAAAGDAYVYELQPDQNFGSNGALRTDNSPLLFSYLRLNAGGAAGAESMSLRVFAETGNALGVELHSVSDVTWTGSDVTFNSAPAIGPVIASSGPVTAGTWLTFDVTAQVTGGGLVSFALTSQSSVATRFSSSEGTNPPALVMAAPETASPYLVTRNGNTYTAQSNRASFSGTLKTAVESAVADLLLVGGGEIIFGAGTYDFGSDHFEFTGVNDITFTGAGIGLTVLRNVNNEAADTEPFDFFASDRIVIRDMTVSAGGSVRTTSDALDFDGGDDILIERVEVVLSRGRGIVFDGKDINTGGTALRNVVRDCVISGTAGSGIELLASSGNRIEGCVITAAGRYGIHVNQSSPIAAQPNKPSTDNLIAGNTITNSGSDGINIHGGSDNQILGNVITNSSQTVSGRAGVWISSHQGVACDANLIEGNLATDNQSTKTQRHGLVILDALCTANVVGDNDFAGNRRDGLLDDGTDTVFTDTSAPAAPLDLRASGVTSSSISLEWDAPTDNYGVAGYDLYRDGGLLAALSEVTTYVDSTVVLDTTYSYIVIARDAAGNESIASNQVVVSISALADTQPPTAPSILQATAGGPNRIDLTWVAAVDDRELFENDVYRDGTLLATVGLVTGYADLTVLAGTSYGYEVRARDAAGNVSASSNTATAATPLPSPVLVFSPTDDAAIRERTPDQTLGSSGLLEVDLSLREDSLLRFDVSGIGAQTILAATLRLFVIDGSSLGGDFNLTTASDWSQNSVTWNTAPAGDAGLIGSLGTVMLGQWVTLDLTGVVTADGVVSFRISSSSADGADYATLEHSSGNAPELVIELG